MLLFEIEEERGTYLIKADNVRLQKIAESGRIQDIN